MSTRQAKTIVLIDDDPIANTINKKIIEKKYTYRVIAFTNAIYALEQLKTWAASGEGDFPCIIFLDINMPHMDGWEFLEEFQKFPHSVLEKCSILLLTSSLDLSHHQKWKMYKCVQDFISKPLTNDKLAFLSQIRDYH